MISFDNIANPPQSCEGDFTIANYEDLINIAKSKYIFSGYLDMPVGQRFILWRHDCDASFERALVLAKIESKAGVKSTYFLNIHSEFDNLFEKRNSDIIKSIVALGHDCGLHFDASYYDIQNADDLERHVLSEGRILNNLLGIEPTAFSFHNPNALHLTFDGNSYGGLINCYSEFFKTRVPYCSDSNGYWRFRRLRDVLESGVDSCLQVLTHPACWQNVGMPPRKRMFLSAYGRAIATMHNYDEELESGGRENLEGIGRSFRFLKSISPNQFVLWDYLLNTDQLGLLLIELLRTHEQQMRRLCVAGIMKLWGVPYHELSDFLSESKLPFDTTYIFHRVFGIPFHQIASVDEVAYGNLLSICDRLICADCFSSKNRMEEEIGFLSKMIEGVAVWGRSHRIGFDGLSDLTSIGNLQVYVNDHKVSDCDDGDRRTVSNYSNSRCERLREVLLKSGVIDGNV